MEVIVPIIFVGFDCPCPSAQCVAEGFPSHTIFHAEGGEWIWQQ